MISDDRLARIFRHQKAYSVYFTTTDNEIQYLPQEAYASGIQIILGLGGATLTGARTLVLPHDNGPLNNGWIIENKCGASVKVRGDTGASITLATGTESLIFSDGTDFKLIAGSSGVSIALEGDASGPVGSTVVTHVTGEDHTKINGTTDVSIQLNGVDSAKFASDGLTLGTADIQILHGNEAPAMSAPNGSIYLRQNGGATTTFYIRHSNVWLAK